MATNQRQTINEISAHALKVKKLVHDGVQYYKANDVAILLGYANYQKAVCQGIPKEYIVQGSAIGVQGNKNDTASRYTTTEGVASLVYNSRLPESIDIARQLGIPLSLKFKKHFHEMDTLDTIMKVFRGEKMLRQYWVRIGSAQRRMDLYFPQYNIALECDENDHKDRDPIDEANRTSFINITVEPHWVRYNPSPDSFDIIRVLGEVYNLIRLSPRI